MMGLHPNIFNVILPAISTGFFLLTLVSASCNPPPDPIILPLQDIQVVSDIPNSFMRGIKTAIGTPPQDIVMLPWADLNNTWIYNYEPFCDSSIIFDDDICMVRRGNFFYENTSTTYEKTTDIVAAGGAPEEISGRGVELGVSKLILSSIGGTDTFIVGSDSGGPSLPEFPIGIPRLNWDHGYTTLHPLGLGSNSTYLNTLFEAGHIAARIWSIFWGRMWTSDPIAGSVIIGGYDRAKVFGENVTAKLDYNELTGCWTGMKVTVSDVQLNFRNGDDISIFPPNLALPCCIVPQRQLLMEAPSIIRGTFNDVTGMTQTGDSFGLHWSAALYDNQDAFDGDLTIHLASGLQIRVPNSQFLPPFVTIDRGGGRIFNESQRELLINSVNEQPATLGRYFLTSAYLMADHDADTFTLWQGNPTTSTDIVSTRVDSGDCSSDSSTPSDFEHPTAEETAESESDESKSPSAAVIGGAVAGGVVALALICVGIIFYLRSKKKAAAAASAESQGGHKAVFPNNPGDIAMPSSHISEAPSTFFQPGSQTTYEMPAERTLVEMDGTTHGR